MASDSESYDEERLADGPQGDQRLSGQDIRNCCALACRFRGSDAYTVSFGEAFGSFLFNTLCVRAACALRRPARSRAAVAAPRSVKGTFIDRFGLAPVVWIFLVLAPAVLSVALDLAMLVIGARHREKNVRGRRSRAASRASPALTPPRPRRGSPPGPASRRPRRRWWSGRPCPRRRWVTCRP